MATLRGMITGLTLQPGGAGNVGVQVTPEPQPGDAAGAQQSVTLPAATVTNEQLTLGARVEITLQRVG